MVLDQYFRDPSVVIDAIVRAYRRTYAINVRRFDPKAGDDAHTFGSQSWRGGIFHLEQEFNKMPGVTVERPNNHLRITLPTGVTLRPYRAHFEGDDLSFSPTSETRARLKRDNTYTFFEYSASFAPDLLPVNELVIQHDGDHLEGLRAIYIGAPLDGEDTAKDWFISECIYVRDTTVADDIDISDEGDSTVIVPFINRKAPDVYIVAEDQRGDDREATRDPDWNE